MISVMSHFLYNSIILYHVQMSQDNTHAQYIPFHDTFKKSNSVQPSKATGKKRPLSKPLPPPDPKNNQLYQTTPTQQMNKTGSHSVQLSNSKACNQLLQLYDIIQNSYCLKIIHSTWQQRISKTIKAHYLSLNELSSNSRNFE